MEMVCVRSEVLLLSPLHLSAFRQFADTAKRLLRRPPGSRLSNNFSGGWRTIDLFSKCDNELSNFDVSLMLDDQIH